MWPDNSAVKTRQILFPLNCPSGPYFSCDSAVSPSSVWGRSKAGPLLYVPLLSNRQPQHSCKETTTLYTLGFCRQSPHRTRTGAPVSAPCCLRCRLQDSVSGKGWLLEVLLLWGLPAKAGGQRSLVWAVAGLPSCPLHVAWGPPIVVVTGQSGPYTLPQDGQAECPSLGGNSHASLEPRPQVVLHCWFKVAEASLT